MNIFTVTSSTFDFVPAKPDTSGDMGRLLPRQVSTGVSRGTQTILGENGQKMILGVIPGVTNTFGIGMYNETGDLVVTLVPSNGGRYTVYSPTENNNSKFIAGKLPDDTYGAAGSNTGFSVEDGFA